MRRAIGALAALALCASGATYVVAPGDTLSGIAARVGASVRALAEANAIADPNRIFVGQVLAIPSAPAAASGEGAIHVVVPGETLSSIAARYGLTVAQLAAANGISDPNRVLAGSRLHLDLGSRPHPEEFSVSGEGGTHVVRPGETLSGIAARHGVTVADLAAANGIPDPNRIRAGATLVVPGGWLCPVQGSVRFIDDYGVAKHGGRFHEGVDLFAPSGTPVVASVPGVVEQIEGERGGLQYWLRGDDGHLYIGTHLDSFGKAGRVAAGDVLGTVGTSGNAAGTSPHLHFEIHPHERGPINPYPTLREACN